MFKDNKKIARKYLKLKREGLRSIKYFKRTFKTRETKKEDIVNNKQSDIWQEV